MRSESLLRQLRCQVKWPAAHILSVAPCDSFAFHRSNCVEDRDCLEFSATTQCCPCVTPPAHHIRRVRCRVMAAPTARDSSHTRCSYCQTLTDGTGCAGATQSAAAYAPNLHRFHN